MNRIALTTLIVSLIGIGAISANAQVSAAVPTNSMDICGKKIELGSPSKIVFDLFEGSGCKVYDTDNPDRFGVAKGRSVIASLKFSHGLLVYVSREWATDIKSPEEFAKAVVNALQEVQKNGSSECVLHAINQANPLSAVRGSDMKCGRETLVFAVTSEQGKETFLIEEILGE